MSWLVELINEASIADFVAVLSAAASLLLFWLTRKERLKAKQLVDAEMEYYKREKLGRLQDMISQEIETHKNEVYVLSAGQIIEQYAGYSTSDAETVLSCLEKQGKIVCKDSFASQKDYYINNDAYGITKALEDGSFTF